jgi:uncharacterized protein
MKKQILLTAFLFVAIFASAQTYYEGKLESLKFGLKVIANPAQAWFYVPEQAAFEIPLTDVRLPNDSLLGTFKTARAKIRGKFSTDKMVFKGQWLQGRASELILTKTEELSFARRPQTPQPPFDYVIENVGFTNSDKSITFGGTFTRPKANGKFTTVLLITGSGQQDRNESIVGHKPFWVIADYLTKNGFAVLRVDDRTMGETTGQLGTSADYAKDALAAVDYLKTRKEVNPKKIGLIGHSEGGMIAPMVAADSKDIAFIVSLAGLGVSGYDLLLKQSDDILKQSGMGDEYRGYTHDLNKTLYDVCKKLPMEGDITDSLKTALNAWIAKQPDDRLGQMGLKGNVGEAKIISQFPFMSSVWYRYFLKYDPAPTLQKIKIPILALNGDKDIQVDSKTNLSAFEANLNKAGNKQFKVIELQGLNHLFQNCKTCSITEYAQLEETFSVKALKIMADWINQTVEP